MRKRDSKEVLWLMDKLTKADADLKRLEVMANSAGIQGEGEEDYMTMKLGGHVQTFQCPRETILKALQSTAEGLIFDITAVANRLNNFRVYVTPIVKQAEEREKQILETLIKKLVIEESK